MNFDLGFKALAYPAANPSADSSVLPCPCSFVFWCDTSKLATLLVVVTIPTTHHAETQFVLQYDADKLDTSGVSLANSNELSKQPQLEEIRCKSKKRSEIKSLCLAIMDPPPLWCATGTQSFSPRPGDEPAFQQFVNLAKASNIRIVFDLLHMRQKDRGMFKAFGKAATHLQRYPVEESLEKQGLERASWKVFTPSEAAGAAGTAGVLPAYEGSHTRKRSRQESPSSPIQPPRRFTHQYSADCCSDHEHSSQSHSSDKTVPFTPEEEAENFRRALGFGHQAELVNAAVKTQLPAQLGQAVEAAVDAAVTSQFRPVLQAILPKAVEAAVARQLPVYFTEGLHTAIVDASVNTQLRPVLHAILPKAVEALFVPSPPGSPILSFDSDGNCYPALPPLSPLGEMLLPHLRSHLTAQIYLQQQQTLQRFEKLARKTFAKLEESAFEDRARAHVEFEDEMEELKSEVLLLKKDAVDEVWREGQELVDKGKEACARFGEDIDHHLGRTLNKIDATVGGNGLRKLVAREMRRQHKGRKKAVPKRRTVSRNNVSKAKEKKGGRGKHGLPGGRLAEVEEWEDV